MEGRRFSKRLKRQISFNRHHVACLKVLTCGTKAAHNWKTTKVFGSCSCIDDGTQHFQHYNHYWQKKVTLIINYLNTASKAFLKEISYKPKWVMIIIIINYVIRFKWLTSDYVYLLEEPRFNF